MRELLERADLRYSPEKSPVLTPWPLRLPTPLVGYRP